MLDYTAPPGVTPRRLEPMQSTVEVDGRAVEYRRAGEGTAVVLSSPTWWPLETWTLSGMTELAESHDVIAFNHRGIGASAQSDGPYTIDSMAVDLLALCDALDVARFHIVGYANGAGVGLAAAQRMPDRVRSLTVAAPSSGVPSTAPSPAEQERKEIAAAGFEALIRSYPTTLAHPSFLREHRAMALALSDAMWTRLGSLENFLKHAEARRGYSVLELATGLAVPALVIVGRDDAAVRGTLSQIDAARALANVLPNAVLSIPENVGHMVFWEFPSLWNDVKAFIRANDGG